MPWVNPNNENDLTSNEFDLYVDLNEEDLGDRPRDNAWVPAHILFEHTDEEIEAMDERDKANGTYIGSSFVFGKNS